MITLFLCLNAFLYFGRLNWNASDTGRYNLDGCIRSEVSLYVMSTLLIQAT